MWSYLRLLPANVPLLACVILMVVSGPVGSFGPQHLATPAIFVFVICAVAATLFLNLGIDTWSGYTTARRFFRGSLTAATHHGLFREIRNLADESPLYAKGVRIAAKDLKVPDDQLAPLLP